MPAISKIRKPSAHKGFRRFCQGIGGVSVQPLRGGPRPSSGIIASGIAYNYLMECFGGNCPFPVVKVSQYPLPEKIYAPCLRLLRCAAHPRGRSAVYREESLRGLASEGKKSMANLQDRWSATENCLPDSVAETVRKVAPGVKELIHREVPGASEIVVSRPPALCPGCGHRDVYGALNDALKEFESPKVFGDIGCYTLGFSSLSTQSTPASTWERRSLWPRERPMPASSPRCP